MSISNLQKTSQQYVCKLLRYCREIRFNSRETVLTSSLMKSGSNIGYHIFETQFLDDPEAKAEKLKESLIATQEVEFWATLLFESGYITVALFNLITKDLTPIRRSLTATIHAAAKKG